MNNLLQKLHANKVNMVITPFDVFSTDVIHICFEKTIHHKSIEIDLRHLFACDVNAEDILILEIEAFLKEIGIEVTEPLIAPEDLKPIEPVTIDDILEAARKAVRRNN